MLEIGSIISLAVSTGDGIFIEGAERKHLGELAFEVFKNLGVDIKEIENGDEKWKEKGFFIARHKNFKVKKPKTVTGTIRTIQDDT
jgi:UDP-N-acetylglucosamine enolpyruvyl transferase